MSASQPESVAMILPLQGAASGVLGLLLGASVAAEVPVCSTLRYGTAEQAAAIEQSARSGSVSAAVAAIRAAQATRGNELGCPETGYAYGSGNPAAPTPLQIRASWDFHAVSVRQALDAYDQCPALGRAAGAYALGLWTGRAAGYSVDRTPLLTLADNLLATQYLPERTPGRQPTWTGLYAYAERLATPGGSCYVQGVVGEGVAQACSTLPALCLSYESGRYAGERFVVGDYDIDAGVADGGGAFDQGWAGVMMIEAALGAGDAAARERYRRSALAAGEWAIHEPAVRNHNYTAKAIWLLAALYDWTGDARFRDALIDKLERNLLPAVLLDADGNGEVDGVPGVRFAELRNPAARMPGRLWDAHNALPWYHAINASAAVEAYAAFRTRGDTAWSARLRPVVIAMLDNLAAELAPAGGLANGTPGTTQVAYAFAVALWKFADVEGLQRPDWERVLWTIWNAGLANSPGDSKTATAGIVAARGAGVGWRSLKQRQARLDAALPTDARISGAWYDPATAGEGWFLLLTASNRLLLSWYTYDPLDPTRQVWLIADTSFDGRRASGPALITRGTRFGPAFDPASVERIPWGTLQIDFDHCGSATLSYDSTISGYGSGVRQLRQLAGTNGLNCEP